MKIGIFDSGMGGLSVLHNAARQLPGESFLYYADEAHVPYGEKQPGEIRNFVAEALDFLIGHGAEAVVIACNTATSVADPAFRAGYPIPIIGMEPAVKRAIDKYKKPGKRILVAATPVTLAGEKMHTLLDRIDPMHAADPIPLPGLVRFAEQEEFDSEAVVSYLKDALGNRKPEDYYAMVLGCTHFNYFKPVLRRLLLKEIHFVDGNSGSVRQLIRMAGLKTDYCEELSDDEALVRADTLRNSEKARREAGCSLEERCEFFFSGKPITSGDLDRIRRYLDRLEYVYSIR